MAKFQLREAEKKKVKLRILLDGVTKGGKTLTSLMFARAAVGPEGKFGVVDTENKSEWYQGANGVGSFTVAVLEDDCGPAVYAEAMKALLAAGCQAIVLDSLSAAWSGRGGVLDIVDAATNESHSKNTFTAGWAKGTPEHNKLIWAILHCPVHLFATVRVKSDYVIEPGKNGKTNPRKVGLAQVQRDGLEYEFDITGRMVDQGTLCITGTRGLELAHLKDKVIKEPGGEFIASILESFDTGVVDPTAAVKAIEEPTQQPPTPRSVAGGGTPRGQSGPRGAPAQQPPPPPPPPPPSNLVQLWSQVGEWVGKDGQKDAFKRLAEKHGLVKNETPDQTYGAVLLMVSRARMRGVGFEEFLNPPPPPSDEAGEIREDDIPF